MKVNEARNNIIKRTNQLKIKVDESNLNEELKSEILDLIYALKQDCSNFEKSVGFALEKFASKLKE